MPALWEARVVMEVCKVDLGFALSEAFIEGCREARADLRYEGRNRSGTLASLRELVHLVRRRDIDGPVHRGTARTWRRGSRPPLPRYTRMQADCGLYFDFHLYNMGFLGGLSHTHTHSHTLTHTSQLGALVPKLNFLSALECGHARSAPRVRKQSNNGPKWVRLWSVLTL